MEDSLICALDLGSTKAVCLIGEVDHLGELSILGAGAVSCIALRRGEIQDMDAAAAAAGAAIQDAVNEAGSTPEEMTVSISGTHVEGLRSRGIATITPRMRPIAHEDILQAKNHSEKMIMPAGKEAILHLLGAFQVDGSSGVKDPLGTAASRLEVESYFAAADSREVKRIEELSATAGMPDIRICPTGIASGYGLLSPEMRDLGTLVIDLGGDVTDITVFHDGGVIYTETIPVGSAHVTSDLMQLLETEYREAERIKIDCGAAHAASVSEDESVEILQKGADKMRPMRKRVLAEMIEARIREIGQMIWKRIVRAGLEDSLTGGIVLTGGGSLLEGTDEVFGSVMAGRKVRVEGPKLKGLHSKKLKNPKFAAAVGLLQFEMHRDDGEFRPASSQSSWKNPISAIKTMFGG